MIMNKLNRMVPDDTKPFISSNDYLNHERIMIKEKSISPEVKFLNSISQIFDETNIHDGITISFHHHLRNGDYVMNMVIEEIIKRNLHDIHLAPSSIFPNNSILVNAIKNGNCTKIDTNYMNGSVANCISEGYLKGMLVMNTHGGRARAIESGELAIDVAILAMPTVDKIGNGTGKIGPTACGSLGYALMDVKYAKKVILVTDNLVDELAEYDVDHKYVDYVVTIPSIGDAKGIVSGTTKITKDPVGLKIARDTTKLLDEIGLIKDGLSMQTGAGGTSLAVASYVKKIMQERHIHGSFASGGITNYYVEMLEEGLFDELYDVQCFDLGSVTSISRNKNHHEMTASKYANPYDKENIASKLDFVILGATEIDVNFNVNVTTDSFGNIIGGSGGHSDTAHGAKVTIITTNLIKSRLPIIKKAVTTITTPGEDVDILVTERGIAINPRRGDLLDKLKDSKLKIIPIERLMTMSHEITGVPKELSHKEQVIGVIEYRDGTIIDTLYKK